MVKLTTKEKFIFTLVIYIFGIDKGTGSKIFITWILFLEKELNFLLPFSTREEMIGVPKPKCFTKKSLNNLRAIIDFTEFYIEIPCKPSSQMSTYSQYKSSNTFKLLISMSPILHVNFLSKLYSGSISDKEIVKASGFLEKLQSTYRIILLFMKLYLLHLQSWGKIMFLHLHQRLQGMLQLQGFILSVSLSVWNHSLFWVESFHSHVNHTLALQSLSVQY